VCVSVCVCVILWGCVCVSVCVCDFVRLCVRECMCFLCLSMCECVCGVCVFMYVSCVSVFVCVRGCVWVCDCECVCGIFVISNLFYNKFVTYYLSFAWWFHLPLLVTFPSTRASTHSLLRRLGDFVSPVPYRDRSPLLRKQFSWKLPTINYIRNIFISYLFREVVQWIMAAN